MSDLPPHQARHSQWDWLSGIRWGTGITNKVCIVAVVVFAVMGIAIFRVPGEWTVVGLALVTLLAFFFFLKLLFAFAQKNPNPS